MPNFLQVLRQVPEMRAALNDAETLKSLSRVNKQCRSFVSSHPRWNRPLLQEAFPSAPNLPAILSPGDTPQALVAGYRRCVHGYIYPKGHDHVLWHRFRSACQRVGGGQLTVRWKVWSQAPFKEQYKYQQQELLVNFVLVSAVMGLVVGLALGLTVGLVPAHVAGPLLFAAMTAAFDACKRTHTWPFKPFNLRDMAPKRLSPEEFLDLQSNY